ncbi:hypothetical protein ACU635_43950 [[Actinomadura] parvosata]|uniref:hypothetical protein n=1 Tax=[Actinomadura] parvosata TaxID=1955412 RepID=UPI00406C90EF
MTRYLLLEGAAQGWPLTHLTVSFDLRQPTLRQGLTRVQLSPGVIDDTAREYFGYGGCCLLAGALHEATEWPLVIAVKPNQHGTFDWAHMGVTPKPGWFFDICGARPYGEVIEEYAATGVHVVTLDHAFEVGAFGPDTWDHGLDPALVEVLRYFAETLFDKYLTGGSSW